MTKRNAENGSRLGKKKRSRKYKLVVLNTADAKMTAPIFRREKYGAPQVG